MIALGLGANGLRTDETASARRREFENQAVLRGMNSLLNLYNLRSGELFRARLEARVRIAASKSSRPPVISKRDQARQIEEPESANNLDYDFHS